MASKHNPTYLFSWQHINKNTNNLIKQKSKNVNKFNDNIDEQLILAVKKYPCIFDARHVDYKKLVVKTKAWEDIGIELNRHPKVCQTKWKGIKDYFFQKKRIKSKNYEPLKEKKPYKYAHLLNFLEDQLEFLCPTYTHNATNNNSTESETINEYLEITPDITEKSFVINSDDNVKVSSENNFILNAENIAISTVNNIDMLSVPNAVFLRREIKVENNTDDENSINLNDTNSILINNQAEVIDSSRHSSVSVERQLPDYDESDENEQQIDPFIMKKSSNLLFLQSCEEEFNKVPNHKLCELKCEILKLINNAIYNK